MIMWCLAIPGSSTSINCVALCRLQEAKPTVNLMKSKFCNAKVTFLGHVVRKGQVAPVSAKIEAIARFTLLADKRGLMRFLGMAGYYRKFCHQFSSIAEPF